MTAADTPKRDPIQVDGDAVVTEQHVADGFSKHEAALVEFLCRYEAVLPKVVASDIENAISHASDGGFEFVWNSKRGDIEPTSAAIKTASLMYDHIKRAIEHLQSHVDSQVGGA